MARTVTRIRMPRTRLQVLPVLVGINLAVYLGWIMAASSSAAWLAFMESNFLVSGASVFSGAVWTPLTSAFSHATPGHLLFNMYALWLFGADVERVLGGRGFLHLYVAGGVVASMGHIAYTAYTGDPTPALGASGAVMAIAVAAATLFPQRRLLLFLIIPLSQYVAVGLFILLDVIGMVSPSADMIAHAAHLGGAAYGWLFMARWSRGYIERRVAALGLRPTSAAKPDWWTHPPA